MGLAEVQAALARLFTDDGLRTRFFDDPVGVGVELGLESSEAVGLAGLSPRHVSQFAASLRSKRVDDASKILPLTAKVLRERFGSILLAAIDGRMTPGRHLDDAGRFVVAIEARSRSGELDPPWVADMARYELTFREAMSRNQGWIARGFRFPVASIARRVDRGESLGSIDPSPSLGIWLRIPGRRGLLHRVVSLRRPPR